jgi:1-deoxy-D-xylulose-5-phosphate synthase
VAEGLEAQGFSSTVINARFVKPLLNEKLLPLFESHRHIFTLEAGTIVGGLGSAISELMGSHGVHSKQVHRLGFKDAFIPHGNKEELLSELGLSTPQIIRKIQNVLS